MTESAASAGQERPPEDAIQCMPNPVRAGQPLGLRDNITCRPELGQLGSQEIPAGNQSLSSEASEEACPLGRASLTLGVAAIGSIGFGFLLICTGVPLCAVLVSIGLGTVLTLPGMALGVASVARKGPSSAAVLGCWAIGLILSVWLLLFAVVWFMGRWQPHDSSPTVAPYHASDYFNWPR